jgi:hypothetical protein
MGIDPNSLGRLRRYGHLTRTECEALLVVVMMMMMILIL